MLYKDKIAGKEHLYFNSIEELEFDVIKKIDLNNFLVGVFENTVRLITAEGMLIIINNSNPTTVYKHLNNRALPFSSLPIQRIDDDGIEENYMRFAGIEGHAIFQLYCNRCADGEPFSYQYDLIGRVNKRIYPQALEDDVTNINSLDKPRSLLTFPLTNTQASIVHKAAEWFFEQSEAGKYQTVAYIRNCITLLNDIYNASYFNWSFLNYMTDEEIMNRNGRDSIFALGFVQNHYQVDEDAFIDQDRKKVHEFATETLGKDFAQNWDSNKYLHLDHELVKKNPLILERTKIILKALKFSCTESIQGNLETWDIKITDNALNIICAQNPAKITYFDLYYYHTHRHEYKMKQLFKDTSYAKYLNDVHRFESTDLICHIEKYKELCGTRMMGNIHVTTLTGTTWWNSENLTELLNKFDKCFVIDENMLNSCPNIYAHDGLIRSSHNHDDKQNDWDMCGILP
jgi:hypothetical protein